MQTQSPNTTLSANFEAVEVYGILIFANLGVTSFWKHVWLSLSFI